MRKRSSRCSPLENAELIDKLNDEQKAVAELINKHHRYFSARDKRFKNYVYAMKVVTLFLSMLNTVVLGVKVGFCDEIKVSIGLVLSALITFLTAVYSYFHLEEYWMRNISIHIRLNILRDEFLVDISSNRLDHQRLEYYIGQLKDLQKSNIDYWTQAIRVLEGKK